MMGDGLMSVLGVPVPVADHAESAVRAAQRMILIDQATRSALSGRVAVESLGAVPFRGKANAVEIFAVDPAQR